MKEQLQGFGNVVRNWPHIHDGEPKLNMYSPKLHSSHLKHNSLDDCRAGTSLLEDRPKTPKCKYLKVNLEAFSEH